MQLLTINLKDMNYQQIAPLVHSTTLVGSQMNVEFKSEHQTTPIAAVECIS